MLCPIMPTPVRYYLTRIYNLTTISSSLTKRQANILHPNDMIKS